MRKKKNRWAAELVNRAKRSKGTTLKIMLKSKVVTVKTDREAKGEVNQKIVEKKAKQNDILTSEGKGARALLKPDLLKPKVYKSLSMPRAILAQINSCIKAARRTEVPGENKYNNICFLAQMRSPNHSVQSIICYYGICWCQK